MLSCVLSLLSLVVLLVPSCHHLSSPPMLLHVATIIHMPETMWIVCDGFTAAISADDVGAEGSASCEL